MPKQSGIYKIENVIDGKCYVGSAINIKSRWAQHKRHLSRSQHHSIKLQRAWDKYGSHAFEFSILETCEPEKEILLNREQHWIDRLDSAARGYNISPTAGSCQGIVLSEGTKEKIASSLRGVPKTKEHNQAVSKSHIGIVPSEESRQKMRDSHTGKKLSEEHKAAIGIGNTGKRHAEESIQKMSDAKKGKKFSDEHIKHMSESHKGQQTWLGKKHSEESRKKQSESGRLRHARERLESISGLGTDKNKSSRSASGFKGVFPVKDKWEARIMINRKLIYLGRYGTPEEASEAYCKAALEPHGEFANFG